MRRSTLAAILALSALTCSVPGYAKLVFKAGTVINVFVSGVGSPAETITFAMSFAAQPTGCTNPNQTAQTFVYTPTDITDAQTRKDMLTLLLAARTSGIPMTVDWDDAGAHCDASGFPIPMDVGM